MLLSMLVLNYFACFEAKICVCDRIEDSMKNKQFQPESVHLCQ